MAKKRTSYFVNDPAALDREFYRRFDPSFLLTKADALMAVVDNYDAIVKLSDSEKSEGSTEEKRKVLERLRAEVYFTELHQFEGLFALMLCAFQPKPHWMYLTTYSTEQIREYMNLFSKRDYKHLTGGDCTTANEFIIRSVYSGKKPGEAGKEERFVKTLENIEWTLRRVADKYLDTAVYNSYKHGLRIMTGRTGLAVGEEGDGKPLSWIAFSEDSLTYLEIKKQRRHAAKVMVTTKHFNVLESYNHLYVMELILRNIKSTRLAACEGNSKTTIWLLAEFDREKISNLSTVFRMSFSA